MTVTLLFFPTDIFCNIFKKNSVNFTFQNKLFTDIRLKCGNSNVWHGMDQQCKYFSDVILFKKHPVAKLTD